jgi:hypothetical protein
MKAVSLEEMTTHQLVVRFAELAIGQFNAELFGETEKYNRLSGEIVAIEAELKSRPGDQRGALVQLLSHPNPQVRLMAAEMTLAVAPSESRQTLQALWDRKEFPQAAYAIGTLRALERGDRIPT